MKKYWIAIIAIAGGSCTLDPLHTEDLPVWSATIDLPLMQTEITLKTFLADSLITPQPVGSEGELIYVFNQTVELERVTVGGRLKLDPIESSLVQQASAVTVDSSTTMITIRFDPVELDSITEQVIAEVGLIELSNIEPEETSPFLFREVMPAGLVMAIEAAIFVAGGSADVVVDTIALVPQQKALAFDSFRSAEVSAGMLDVTIINELFIPLGAPIVVEVRDSTGLFTLFDLQWDTEIGVGDSATRTRDLSGTTLPGALLIVVSGTSNGSQGDTVTVTAGDLDSGFRTRVAVRALEVSQTDAIVPAQTIRDTSAIALAPSETIIEVAVLQSGNLSIAVTNDLPLTGQVSLTIPSLYLESVDSVFRQNFELQTGTYAIPVSDLTGWSMSMSAAQQELRYHYAITTDDTDPQFVALAQSDFVAMDLAVRNITLSQITGQIETQTILDSGDVDIESDSQILRASISAGSIEISIQNRIGGESQVRISVPELSRGGSLLDTVLGVIPGARSHVIDLSGYELMPVSLADQRLTYRTETVTQGGFYTYDLQDSIDVDVRMSELTFDAITGFVSQEDIIAEYEVELDSETKVERAVIEAGEVQLTIRNFIGLEASLELEIAELAREDSILVVSLQLTSSTEPQVHRIDIAGYSLSLPLEDQRIHYTSTLTIPSDELVALTLDDSITVDVFIDTLRLTSLTGVVESFDVALDTVEQSISPLPEEMDGFEFANVEIILEFDVDMTVPVLLDLTLEAQAGDGSVRTATVTGWNIVDSSRVVMPDATELINIRPERILAYGRAHIGGGGAPGTVTSSQGIAGTLAVRAPLEFELGPDALIITEPHRITGEDAAESVSEDIEEVLIFVEYVNQFEFGATLRVLMSQDTLRLGAGVGEVLVDSLVLSPKAAGLDSVLLNDARLDLFNQDSMYIQAHLRLLGRTDENGDQVPARFLSTDTLRLNLYGRLQYLLDGADLVGGGP
ncbi:MAG: hypothetical protein IH971_01970 [Candidatus Marinimicrobia bacterium]|nr:hypothetical protein [Candidatus Neomarinimicrobiota bacterium]